MKRKKILQHYIALWLMSSLVVVPMAAGAAGNTVVSNNTLPTNGTSVMNNHNIAKDDIKHQMDITQTGKNGIITWKDFSIGANATVNFKGEDKFNTLNYVTGANSSQIYGKMNANNNGNIYLVNPNGVQIGNSAQINVGSLYVSTKKIDNIDSVKNATDYGAALKGINTITSNAELMSLGYITANKVTFEGNRVVIDMDRLQGLDTTKQDALTINSKRPYKGAGDGDEDNRFYDVVLGTDKPENAADWGKYMTFVNAVHPKKKYNGSANAEHGGKTLSEYFAYRWIKDGSELQKIGQDAKYGLDGQYALRNAIDLTGEKQTPIGQSAYKAFTGKFDGLSFNIFGLTMDNTGNKLGSDATGLFGYTKNALIGHFNLIAGTDDVSIKGGDCTGALIGHAVNTRVYSVANTLKVTGGAKTGGLIGYAEQTTDADTVNQSAFRNLINTGNVNGTFNVGGIIGQMKGGTLGLDERALLVDEETHNVGKITGSDANVGGLVGMATNARIGGYKADTHTGDNTSNNIEMNANAIYNAAAVEGKYNVGGIVGQATDTSVINVRNETSVLATGYTTENYTFRTDYIRNNLGFTTKDGMATIQVRMANAGGIVGTATGGKNAKRSNIFEAVNSGDVQSTTKTQDKVTDTHYAAGNVGGIAGRAENTDIYNVTNKENEVRGAMNVGGVAGYFGMTNDTTNTDKTEYRVSRAENDGGNILATGGIVADGDFAKETTRSDYDGGNKDGNYIIGNIGGIAGLVTGSRMHIETSGNRGVVHTGSAYTKQTSQAINVGGIAGKIDVNTNGINPADRLKDIKEHMNHAVISGSYNSGEVEGYANIGGIAGFAYNGSIAESYNIGHIKTTRSDASGETAVNLGGILGDSTEKATGRVVIYDTYNKGDLGAADFSTYGRHFGGIVGRLSGIVGKSYNAGNIYDGSCDVGGIAGYWYAGEMKNVFNTGNITVSNKNSAESQVGGIVGGVDVSGGNDANGTNADMSLTNAYNIGSLRSFKEGGANALGGIVGFVVNWAGASNKLNIQNVYTGGNLYADSGSVGAIVGAYKHDNFKSNVEVKNAFYIQPRKDNGYLDLTKNDSMVTENINGVTNSIAFDDRYKKASWTGLLFSSSRKDGKIEDANENNWRMNEEDGNLPILNAFLPGSHDYFSNADNWKNFKEAGGISIQYGTAYDPLLTIIHTSKDLTFDWANMNLKNNGALAVYDGGLTLNGVHVTNSTGIFGGTIYSDGKLTMTSKEGENDIVFGAGAELYGSSVDLKADGKLTIIGKVQATGNEKDKEDSGDITIHAGELDVYGKLITSNTQQGGKLMIPGIGAIWTDLLPSIVENVKDKNKQVIDLGERFAHFVDYGKDAAGAARNGNLTITTQKNTVDELKPDGTTTVKRTTSGDANLYYGNQKAGAVNVYGQMDITAAGNILSDTNLTVNGKINMNAAEGTTGNEIILDISHMGGGTNEGIAKFLKAHTTEDTAISGSNGAKNGEVGVRIALDAWDAANKRFDDMQYDSDETFRNMMQKLYVNSNGKVYGNAHGVNDIHDVYFNWISNAEQLAGVQKTAEAESGDKAHILEHNFMLKNDIDASNLKNFQSIGSGNTAYTGVFDGRGQRLIGLTATDGLFQNLGGTAKNLHIYSSVFTGDKAVGAVAGTNQGIVDNITGLGNTISGVEGSSVGGLVGINKMYLTNSSDQSTIIADKDAIAGGLVGQNVYDKANGAHGFIVNAQTNSAVTMKDATDDAKYMGGIVGSTEGKADAEHIGVGNVSAHGVTGKTGLTQTAGGIAGHNEQAISEAYNNSVIHGKAGLGGIAGENTGTIQNIANAVEIIGDAGSTNVGGLVGNQKSGIVKDGRNTGTITGGQNVGGMVGVNGKDSMLKNLENGSVAKITGVSNVGGIAGQNDGTISAEDQSNLLNEGEIYGWENVGGIAGKNTGTIENVNSDIQLHAISKEEKGQLAGELQNISESAQYFGGVTGDNVGTIKNATNSAKVDASEAIYVGGIAGRNHDSGKLLGMGNSNKGEVIGKNFVGGVIGKNEVALTGTVADHIGAKNLGKVIATGGGAGGIIGENAADMTYVEFTNEGEVHGNAAPATDNTATAGTGGILGVNSGKITNSSLMNTVKGQVTGISNVGGLIGINKGEVTGGRDENDNYYKYQIYNNGTIQVGAYQKTNDTGDYALNTNNVTGSENIGGLIGDNQKSLTAGYNTGVIEAGSSTNVGGIAGSNSGTMDQVFTNVMTENGQDQTITGASNVGGIVGSNANGATIFNAYTAKDTTVNGSTSGLIAGTNTGTISNVYANGTLTGNSSTVNNGKDISATGTDWTKSDSYKTGDKSFDFTNTWKIYEDHTNPLLKVFLTKATVSNDAMKNLTYNGKNQLDIDTLIQNGKLTNQKDTNFADYKNSNSLLSGSEMKNAGDYQNWLWSAQIGRHEKDKDSEFNPNNLGYDFTVNNVEIGKAKLAISLDDVYRIYGNGTMYKDESHSKTVDYSDLWHLDTKGMTEEMKNELLNDKGLSVTKASDGAVNGLASGKTTNDVGKYDLSMKVSLSDAVKNNYTVDSSITKTGGSHVDKANLTINLNDIKRTYGDTTITEGSYSLKDYQDKLVNGDSGTIDLDKTKVSDGGLAANGMKTNDVKEGGYTLHVSKDTLTGTGLNLKNYDITVSDGKSYINPKEVSLKDLEGSIIYGSSDGIPTGPLRFKEGDIVYGDDVTVKGTVNIRENSSYTKNKGQRNTADVGIYENSLKVDHAQLNGTKAGNYKLVGDANGTIEVTKAKLNLTVGNANTTYGTQFDESQYGYSLSGNTNGDSEELVKNLIGNVGYTNSAAKDGTNGVWTADAGTYTGAIGLAKSKDKFSLKNYDVDSITNGTATIDKAQLHVHTDDQTITVGQKPNYTGQLWGLVNGDTEEALGKLQYGAKPEYEQTVGTHSGVIQTVNVNSYGELPSSYLKNYKFTYDWGNLTVQDAIPDTEFDYLFYDTPWDRPRNFRERRAELHFVDGGVHVG